MDNVIKNLKKGIPFSLTSQLNVMEWRDKQKNNFAAKYVVTELAFIGTTITSTLEGVGALVASLVVNALNYVVPKKYDFNTKVVKPVLNYRHHTRMALSHSLVALVNNVITKEPIKYKTIETVEKFYVQLGIAALNVATGALHAVANAVNKVPQATRSAQYAKMKEVACEQLKSGKTFTEALKAGIDR